MHRRTMLALLVTGLALLRPAAAGCCAETREIAPIDPPENGFFSKRLDYEGIPIKAHKDVADEALHQARARLAMMLDKLAEVRRRLQKAGAELHIIGRNQVTSDLPEFRHMKGKPFDGKKTIDERTRGMGGLLTSCGEENLLRLEADRYRGRDICVHEFAHNIQDNGMTEAPRARIRRQHQRSLAQGLWKGSYAGSNEHEFFAELSMWYWGTHGDLGMQGTKPANGRDGLRAYDPEACALLDDVYGGKLEATTATIDEARVAVVPRPDTAQSNPYYPGNRPPLVPSPFIRLPTGSVKPKGWLRRQLEFQAEGYLGHMGEVSGSLNKTNNAWLDTAGKGGCFWEEVPYWLRGYVSMAYLLDDPKLIEEARLWLEPSLKGQRPNGYFGTQALAGDATHAPDLMPHQNMLYAYRAYYDATGDRRVLDLMTRYFHWELTLDDKMFFNGGWGAARNSDNMDMAYWLYNRTGDAKLLELGEKLMRTGDRWMGRLGGCHNVAFCQGFRKPAVFYQQNHDPKYLAQMASNYSDIYDVYGQVPGGMFGGDEFARPSHTDPQQAIETCGAVEMMFSSQILLRITGDLKWMDRCENIAYNTLPATMTADFRGLRYLTSPNQCNSDARSKAPTLADDGPMQVMNPRDHHCCQHNVSCAWPYFVESLYEATPDRGLAAMMYAPCTVTARVGDGTQVTIEQKTRYPFEDRAELSLSCPKSVAFPLYLRIPAWCMRPRLRINGHATDLQAKGGDLVQIARTWADGDKLAIELPMDVTLTRWMKNKNSVSVNHGPLTFSIRIGENYVRQHPERKDDKWPAFEIVPTTPWNYGLALGDGDTRRVQVVRKEFPADNQLFTLDGAPVELKVPARRIPQWTENYFGVVDKLQPSPIRSSEAEEIVMMVPMGAARLRMSALPVVGEGPDARPWVPTSEPISSWSEDPGILKTLTDPRDPKDSRDGGVGMFLMYGSSLFGSKQWIRMPLGEPRTVSRSKTYWWTEFYEHGGVRPPAFWRLFYKDGDTWKPVPNARGYGVALNQYNEVTFDPVKTTELKMEIQFQPGRCGSLIRWRVE